MRYLSALMFFLLFTVHLWGQEAISQDKITLHSGDVYVGEIVLNTPEIVMLRTHNGSRFQFQQSEIKKIEKESSVPAQVVDTENNPTPEIGNFGIIIELAGGTSQAQNSFGWSPNVQASLTFGGKKVFNDNLFLGLGIGYNSSYIASQMQPTVFVPIFARVQSTLSKKRTSPFVGMDIGYGLATDQNHKGGFLVKLSGGISHRISYKSTLFAGIFAGVQTFSGTLSEQIGSDTFIYYGETSMKSVGMKVGLLF